MVTFSSLKIRNIYILKQSYRLIMESAFLKAEGNTVRNRLWDFLITYADFDYSMKDIAKFSKISYTAMKDVWKEFVDRKIVIHTRIIGKAKMYKLNRNSALVEAFVEYYWTVVDMAANKEIELEKKRRAKSSRTYASSSSSSSMALPLSASRV